MLFIKYSTWNYQQNKNALILLSHKILLNAIKDGTQAGEIIFSDEKMFTVEAKFNSQNDKIFGKECG